MIYGLDEFYSGLIEEAKSPEEIKKILDYQFVQGKGVPREVLDSVFDIDPTKKKSYTRWVLMQYDRYGEEILKAIRSGKLERMFKTFKERASDSENGGLDLTNMESFKEAMDYIPDIDPCLTKEGDPNSPENDFDVIYDTDDWTIAVPHTYEANRKLGRGCNWCTAGAFGDNDSWWRRYSPAGPIFVNYDRRHSEVAPKDHKEYPYTRYQLLFEWQNWAGELKDSDDIDVDFDEVNMPEEVIEFYGSKNPRYKEMIENGGGGFESRWTEYNDERADMAISVIDGDGEELYLLPEQNDEMNLNTDYMLYSSDDFSDSFETYYFSGPEGLRARGSDGKSALLKDIRDRYIYAWIDEDGDFSVGVEDNHWVDPSGEVIFILGNNSLCILPRTSHFDTTAIIDLYKSFGNSYIENVEINPQISQIAMDNGIEGYHGLVCEITFDDLYHGLFMYDGYDVVTMIKKDIPQADMFEAVADNGNICIKGASFDYKFGKGGKADASNLQVYYEMDTANGEKYYFVTYGEDEEYCNVYNVAQRKLIFESPCSHIDQIRDIDGNVSLLLCEFINSSKALYSINKGEFLIPPCSHIDKMLYDSWGDGQCWVSKKTESSPVTLYYYDESGFRKIMDVAEANGILRSDDGGVYTFITLINGGITVLNLKNGEFPIKETDFVARGSMRDANFCFLQNPEQKQRKVCSIYNFVTGEKMVDDYNYGLGRPARLYRMDIWKIKCANGENLIDRNGKLLLPRNVDAILDASKTDPELIPLRDNNHMWFLNPQNMELLPTKEGIDLNVFQFDGTEYSNLPKFKYKGYEFKIKPENGKFELYCVPPQGQGYSNEIENEIRSLLFKQQAAIRESFNRVLNMINNFYKDKD